MPEVKPWSYSALTAYETCPKKYWHLSVGKDVKEPPSEILEWGSQVHKAVENNIKKDKPLPMGMKQFGKVVEPLKNAGKRAQSTAVELKLALDRNFQPCGWFGEQVWVRSVLDYAIMNKNKAMLIDWKTGKRRENEEQLSLMTAVMFAQDEDLEAVDSAFVWLAEPPSRAISRVSYSRADLPRIWDNFLPRVERYEAAHRHQEFPAKPNFQCERFCPVKSCPYNGR